MNSEEEEMMQTMTIFQAEDIGEEESDDIHENCSNAEEYFELDMC